MNIIYRTLGKTGLKVSALSLGTASLGMDYGIYVPGNFGRPDEKEAINLVQRAADRGINLFDSAPSYGDAEKVLGKALVKRKDCILATKVNLQSGIVKMARISQSIQKSLRLLKRDVLDIVQIHNATRKVLLETDIVEYLSVMRKRGYVRFIGASVYGEDNALAAIEINLDVVQVAYNILDQRMSKEVFPAAFRAKVGIMTRSGLLKGALSVKARHLPEGLTDLKLAAKMANKTLGISWRQLPSIALRFCLSSPQVSTVLAGPRTVKELEEALKAIEKGPISTILLDKIYKLALQDDLLLNPSCWTGL